MPTLQNCNFFLETLPTRLGRTNCTFEKGTSSESTVDLGELVMNSSYEDCIAECLRCAMACESCASACLEEQDVKMMAACIKLDRDCADICRLAATLMARGSPFANEICVLCAKICKACGQECGTHEAEHCQQCSKACLACAQACESMAA